MTAQEMNSVFEALSAYDTPTLCNALECFPGIKRGEGFMDYTIQSVVPCRRTRIGKIATAKIAGKDPADPAHAVDIMDYYAHVKDMGPGCLVVQEDVDEKPVGSFWGRST